MNENVNLRVELSHLNEKLKFPMLLQLQMLQNDIKLLTCVFYFTYHLLYNRTL